MMLKDMQNFQIDYEITNHYEYTNPYICKNL